ncbi:MAG: cytosine permease [Acidobacteriota bacterium]|nr:cytosine permease [Acidobacteriota bacterium]
METGLDLSPVPAAKRTASLTDVVLLFAGANIVTTTLVTGGSLSESFSFLQSALLVGFGVVIGTLPIALLARLGPRFGLPTMVLLRHPFGRLGAGAISLILILTNFAWIALNNVIAAEAMATLVGGSEWQWNLVVGAIAIGVALTGPRAMALFDRLAVPLMVIVGLGLTVALFGEAGREVLSRPGTGTLALLAGLDIVVGYQISWSLMFADYTRFQTSARSASLAVFLGMTLSSLWLMTVGVGAGIAGGGNSPTEMILGLGLPLGALLLMALSAITTNFVNIYLSSLAVKNLWGGAPERITVLAVGSIGVALGLFSPRLLDRYAGFMELIATLLLPIVAVAAVHFFGRIGHPKDVSAPPAWSWTAALSWLAGVLTYQNLPADLGATVPTLLVTALVYTLFRRLA